MNEKYYFAYGSNLDTDQMKDRIKNWITSSRAHVEGYKRVYNVWSGKNWNGWAANLEKTGKSSDKVYGAVYVISGEQIDILTKKYEHISPTSISVIIDDNGQKNANAYIWSKKEPSHEPPEPYKNAIIRGLKQHGYTQDIIEKIQREFTQV